MLSALVVCVLLTVGVHGEDSLMRDILNKIQHQSERVEQLAVSSERQAAALSALAEHGERLDEQLSENQARIERLSGLAKHGGLVGFHVTTTGQRRLSKGDPLVLDIVDVNSGAGYNAQTGTFTAPEAAFYLFTASVFSDGGAAFALYVDGNVVTTNHADGSWGWGTLTATVRCAAGATVQVRCARDPGCNVRDSSTYVRATTFSGFRIH